jgi:hypothetical protein
VGTVQKDETTGKVTTEDFSTWWNSICWPQAFLFSDVYICIKCIATESACKFPKRNILSSILEAEHLLLSEYRTGLGKALAWL